MVPGSSHQSDLDPCSRLADMVLGDAMSGDNTGISKGADVGSLLTAMFMLSGYCLDEVFELIIHSADAFNLT